MFDLTLERAVRTAADYLGRHPDYFSVTIIRQESTGQYYVLNPLLDQGKLEDGYTRVGKVRRKSISRDMVEFTNMEA